MNISSSVELEKLVAMAEEVSATVSSLHTKIASLRVMCMVSVISMYFAMCSIYLLLKGPSWMPEIPRVVLLIVMLLVVCVIIFCFLFIFRYMHNIKLYKQNLNTEVQILHRLLDMVHEYKENLHEEEINYVEKAILDMRLQRIRYSTKW